MEVTISLASREEALVLFGLEDRNLKLLRDSLGVRIAARNTVVRVQGDKEPLENAAGILERLLDKYRGGEKLPDDYVERELYRLRNAVSAPDLAVGGAAVDGVMGVGDGSERCLARGDESLVATLARSPGQRRYMESILENDIVFCIGPAGTGKTFLAVSLAVHFLRAGEVRRLVLCRPAVEAGEKLGFLPGDFQAKINPYLRPLYDALNDVLGYEQVKRYLEREIIEIIPLAYMRGRTLNSAFIILDEGQNTSVSQMKMFLTRMGADSRIVVNGDITQVDLPSGQPSGLIHARKAIRDIDGIGWIRMQKRDIVRHPLVQRIVEAYEKQSASDEDAGSQ